MLCLHGNSTEFSPHTDADDAAAVTRHRKRRHENPLLEKLPLIQFVESRGNDGYFPYSAAAGPHDAQRHQDGPAAGSGPPQPAGRALPKE